MTLIVTGVENGKASVVETKDCMPDGGGVPFVEAGLAHRCLMRFDPVA